MTAQNRHGKIRVAVEHAIAQLKAWRILSGEGGVDAHNSDGRQPENGPPGLWQS